MPHVGKYVPWLMKNQVGLYIGSAAFYRPPPRKIWLHVRPLGNTGTYPVAWAGVTVISSVGDYDSADSTITTWTCTHPTLSTHTMEFRAKYRESQNPTTLFVSYWWDTELIARDGSTQVGKYTVSLDYGQMFVNASPFYNFTGTWPVSVGLPVFQNLGMQIRSATWAEQPEYHPYRH